MRGIVGAMSDYAAVDGVIDLWVKATGSTLFTEWEGQPTRFFHVPGEPPFECFQISIELPSADSVSVRARAIDTNDGRETELENAWRGSVADLHAMLSTAVATIETWKGRLKPERH
ncbi:MAG TPA: hypothetical protein VFO69_08030 [Allosphingosinicella sp.]|nr:hypothetical protein [Allosphingosinicella sp.]